MKFEVVERLPGARGLVVPEIRDSDDESDPDDQGEEKETTGQAPTFNADEYTWSDSESTGSAGSGKDDEEGEEDEFDFSQAQLQREIALEYIRLRGTIGAEAHQAMTSHTHSGENEWDQPVGNFIPLSAHNCVCLIIACWFICTGGSFRGHPRDKTPETERI